MRAGGHRFVAIVALVIAIAFTWPEAIAATRPVVAIVRSSRIAPFVAATQAVESELRGSPSQPELLVFDLDGDAGAAKDVMRRVADAHPAVIVPIGSLAATVVLAAPSDVPVVFSMVLYPAASGFLRTDRPVTGVSLDIPDEVVFRQLADLLPGRRRIGVLHSAETASAVSGAIRAARDHGFSFVEESVSSTSEVSARLRELLPRVDVLWTVADTKVLTPETTGAMILASMERRVAMIGLSAAHVRAGALLAFSGDHADVGRQTGEIVLRVLAGEPAGAIRVAPPRHLRLTLNSRTAKWLALDLSDRALRGVEIVE